MAVTQAICSSFKEECLEAIHDFSSDTFKMALYDRTAASLGASTTAYTSTGEASGTGYTAGGAEIAVTSGYPQLSGTVAEIRFDNEAWTSASFTAGAALIYNSSKSDRAVCVLDFGTNRTVTNGTFTVEFPTALSATIRLS